MPVRKRARTRSSIPGLQRQIDAIRAGLTSSLDLSDSALGMRVREVPDEIRGLEGLRVLVVGGNSAIDRLPSWLRDLPDLQAIEALDHPMASLPHLRNIRWGVHAETLLRCRDEVDPAMVDAISIDDRTSQQAVQEVFDLGRSRALRLSELMISSSKTSPNESRESAKAQWPLLGLLKSQIGEFIDSQRTLSLLSVFGCPLESIPRPVRRLRSLTALNLKNVWLETIPDWLFDARALTSLDLSFNGLTDLPESIGRALNLRTLDLSHNPIARIPDGFFRLEALETLYLKRCPIVEIPADILRLRGLSNLELDAEKLVVPPPEVAAHGLEAIKRYWSQKLEVGVDFLAEAKLLIVGEAGAARRHWRRRSSTRATCWTRARIPPRASM